MKSIKITGLIIIFFSFSIGGFSQLWKQYADSAKVYTDQKNTDKAIEFYSKEKDELQKDSTNGIGYLQICDSLSVLFYRKKEYKEAEKYYIETKQLSEKLSGKQNPGYATTCYNLAILYRNTGKYEKAEPLFLETMQLRKKLLGIDNTDYANSCFNLAILYFQMGQYEKSDTLYRETLRIQKKVLGIENPDYAKTCNNLAIVYKNMGKYEKAEPLYLEAMQLRKKLFGIENADYAGSCNNLGALYEEMGQYGKAEPLYLEAVKIRERVLGKENPDYAHSCNNLGGLYNDMGQYEKAEPFYLQAKQIQEKLLGKEHPDYALTCSNLALLYENIGQYGKAEFLYIEAKQIQEKLLGKEHPDYASTCFLLADLYDDIGQYDKSEPLFMETMQIEGKTLGKEHPDYARLCMRLGQHYYYMRQYQKAAPLFLEGKQIMEKVFGKENLYYAVSCNNLGQLYDQMGQYEKSETLYKESMQITEKLSGRENSDYADVSFNLASLYQIRKEYGKAKPLYLETKEILGKVLGKQHPYYSISCKSLANLYWLMHQSFLAENELKEAFAINTYNLFNVFQFTNEEEKTAYIKNISGEDDEAYSFYFSEKIKSALPNSLALFHRNLILSSLEALKKQILSSNDSSLINKYNDWLGLKKYLAVLYSIPVADRKEDPAKIEEKADEKEKDLTRLSSGFKKQQQKIDWKDIQDRLKADEVSIEFVAFHYYNGTRYTDSTYYIALVLRKNELLPELVRLFEKKQLDALLAKSDRLTDAQRINSLYTRSSALYNLVWKPLDKYLKGITRVYFAPAGNLYKISFAAIPISANQVLSDKYQMVQLNTTANIVDSGQSTVNVGDKIQLFGGIQYTADSATLEKVTYAYREANENSRSLPDDLPRGAGFQYLPGTLQEVETIKKLAGNRKESITVLTGTDATEESVKALDGKASPSVLHFATHGFFFPDAKDEKTNNNRKRFDINGEPFKQSDNPLLRSGLLFAGANNAWKGKPIEGIDDGILTSYEVSNMNLPNTKLVVLSACNTALGEIQGGEGVYGLQRAFKMAGAKYLVMSLWKVLDAETSEFMQLFYKNLFADQTINDAFYNAQQAMKNKYRAEPYKWAAWVLVR